MRPTLFGIFAMMPDLIRSTGVIRKVNHTEAGIHKAERSGNYQAISISAGAEFDKQPIHSNNVSLLNSQVLDASTEAKLVSSLRLVFDAADENKNGVLDAREVESLIEHYGPRSDLDWRPFSKDGSGLDFEDFEAAANMRLELGPVRAGEALISDERDLKPSVRRRKGGGCFPASARVMTKEHGWRELRQLQGNELIATADLKTHQVRFERFLADLHSEDEHKQVRDYIRLEHEFGSLDVSPWHFVRTEEHGFLPAIHVKKGQHLMVADATSQHLQISKVVSIREVSRSGIYSPLTFSGNVLIDGVLASTYTADEFHAFLSFEAQEKLLKLVKDFNGIDRIMHALAFPLRFSYYVGLPGLLRSASAAQIPGSGFFLRFFAPDQQNAVLNAQGDGQAAYVQYIGKLFGGVVNTIVSFQV